MSDYSGVRVLVTGASGFLGSHVAERLVSEGAQVHAFIRDSSSTARLDHVAGSIVIHRGDVVDHASLLRCFRAASPEIVFHLAGDSTGRRSSGGWDAVDRSIAVNLAGTVNVLRAAAESGAGVRSVVRVGGLEEYGRCAIPFVEGDRELPVSSYSAAQVSATHFCQALQPDLTFQVVTARPALVYGPRQAHRFFIPQLIESCLAGTDFDMTDGTQGRDLVYVSDVVNGLLIAAATPDLRGSVINLATGEEHALFTVADHIVRMTRASIVVRKGARPTGHSDLQHLVGSTEHAARTLGWRSRIGLTDGLALTIEWHRDQLKSPRGRESAVAGTEQ